MGLSDRTYWREEPQPYGALGRMRIGVPRPAEATTLLLVTTVAAFVVQVIFAANGVNLSRSLGVTLAGWWQVWRYATFQFLHGGLWHIFLNMLVLYMFGSALERQWGPGRLVVFYLTCGAAAGAAYVAMSLVAGGAAQRWVPLIGASGGVYGILLACVVLFPHMRVLFFLFPMSMRTMGLIIFGIAVLTVLGGAGTPMFWSQVAHLGGAGMGAVWIWGLPRMGARRGGPRLGARLFGRLRQGAWERRLARRRREEGEIDRILDRIHRDGVGSLTRGEKRALQDATRRQREEDRRLKRL